MLKLKHALLSVALMLTVATASFTQPQMPGMPKANQAKASSIYKVIPADCYGFVSTNNVQNLLDASKTYAGEIGMANFVNMMAPTGFLMPIAMQLGLAENYNPNGGAAVVMCDFKRSGIDPEKLFAGEADVDEPPLAIVLAGNNVKKTFRNTVVIDGKTYVAIAGERFLAKQVGDYIVLAKDKKIIDQFGNGKTIADVAGKEDMKFYKRSHLNVHVNVEQVYPLLALGEKAIDREIAKAEKSDDEWKKYQIRNLKSQKNSMASLKQLADFRSMNMGMTYGKKGVYVDVCATAKQGTAAAKQLQSAKPLRKNPLAKLPSGPYVIAGAATVNGATMVQSVKQMLEQINNAMQTAGGKNLDKGVESQVIKLTKAFGKQIRGMSFVAGGAKDGLYGLAAVYDCKKASKVRKLFPRKTKLLNSIVAKMLPQEARDEIDLKFEYKKNAMTVGAVQVDTMTVDFAQLDDMDAQSKAQMKKILGDSKIRIFLAQVDDNTVVVTFGGGETFLKRAIKAAKNGGPIGKDAGVKEAFKALPGKKVGVMIFSPKNLLTVVMDGFSQMGVPVQMVMPFQIDLKVATPIAGASYVKGNTGMFRLYIPNKLVKEIVLEAIRIQAQMKQMDGGGRRRPPMQDPDDDGAF